MKIVTALLMIIVLSCSVVYGQTEKDSTPIHYLMVMYGKNQLYFDSINSHQIISIGYNPMQKNKGFGLNAWYLKDDHTSYYGYKESWIIIQPSTQLLYESFALKLGINVCILSKGEESGLKLWQPAVEIKYGIIKKLYFSAGYRSDMFFGRITANLHYMLNDNISEIMLGYTYKEDWNEDYNGFTYKFNYMIFRKLLLRVCGNVDFKFNSKGIQGGVGMLF